MLNQLFKNVQVLSAVIWALAIIGCSLISDKSHVSTILIAAAGFHVVLLAQSEKGKRQA